MKDVSTNRIRQIREQRDLNGTEVAKTLGISPQYYYDLEKGTRRLNEGLIKQLADFYEISTDYLLGYSDNPISKVSTSLEQLDELIKVDPDLLVEMCRAKDLPSEERRRIKEFAAFEIERYLKEKDIKKSDGK